MSQPRLALAPLERIIWQAERQNTGCTHALIIGASVACLVAAAVLTSIDSGFVYKAVAVVGCLLFALRAIFGISGTPKSYTLTNHRVIELDQNGRSLWRDGSPLARTQLAKVHHGFCGSFVTIYTVQMDHGDPETINLGPLLRADALTLVELLRSVAHDAGSQAW